MKQGFRSAVILLASLMILPGWLKAQKDEPVGFKDIFADLLLDDPAANSVLLENEDPLKKIRKNIFVRPVLSKKRCFIGEPILLTLRLYTCLQSTSTVVKWPYVPGFTSSSLRSRDSEPTIHKQDNKQFRVYTVVQWELIAEQPGKLKVDSIKIDNKVEYKDATDQAKTYSGLVSSSPVYIHVDSLPAKNKPSQFSGVTGKFDLTVYPQFNDAPAEKSNILQVELSGWGNLRQARLPFISWPADIDTFSVDETIEMSQDSFPVTGRKIFKISFIPRKEGVFTIPSLFTSYFDPLSRTYKTLKSDPIKLNVLAAEKSEVMAPQPVAPQITKRKWILYGGILAAIALIVGAALYFIRRKQMRKAVDIINTPPEDPELSAARIAESFKHELNQLSAIDDPVAFINRFKGMLTGFIQAKLGTSLNLEEELLKKLDAKDMAVSNETGNLFRKCNTLLYSPGDLSPGDRSGMIESISNIFRKLEQV
jgi:hypothetical protein